jgi:hypothetical protein
LLNQDRGLDLYESVLLVEPSPIAMTEEQHHVRSHGACPAQGLTDDPLAEALAATGRGHEHATEPDESHRRPIFDLKVA